jgi:hypothetical protein
MKIDKFLIAIALLFTIISCKNGEKSTTEAEATVETAKANPNVFKITLNAVITEDDSFQVYYKNDAESIFDEKNSIFVEFKGSNQPQDIVFNLPEDELPNYLRLDFGTNKQQKEITVNSFKIDYLGKTFEAKGKDFFNYFYTNELVKVDRENLKVTPLTSKEGIYDPIFTSEDGLKNQINLLVK